MDSFRDDHRRHRSLNIQRYRDKWVRYWRREDEVSVPVTPRYSFEAALRVLEAERKEIDMLINGLRQHIGRLKKSEKHHKYKRSGRAK